MSYNGSGTFVINSSGQPVVTGTVISSTAFNALTADLATGLSTAITKDGQTTTTARILFAQGISSTLTTDATSTTTGSIITAGGISTQKALFVGTTSNFAGAISSSAGISNGTAGQIGNSISQNSLTSFQVTNSNAGAAAQASYRLYNGNTIADLSVFGTAFTTDGVRVANGVALDARPGGAADLALLGTTIRFATSGTTEFARFNTSGLGIGMTPSNILDITQNQNAGSQTSLLNNSAGANANAAYKLNNGTNAVYFALSGTGNSGTFPNAANMSSIQTTGGALALTTGSATPIQFGINYTEAARIDSSGNYQFGTTTNVGSASFGTTIFSNGSVQVSQNTTGAAAVLAFYNPNGAVGTIQTSGSSTSYVTSSDYRLKENVQPMTGGLATVAALKPVTYDWIIDKSDGEGFIAHELQAVIPAAVTGEKDAINEDGSIKPQGVDFSKIVPHLVAAIQELTTRLAALENK